MNPIQLQFDKDGLLLPHEAIEVDLPTIEQFFVLAFPNSKTRKRLFYNFEKYINQLQNEVFPWFEVWVDGSFVTMKENPKDVDMVVLLDYQVFDLKEKVVEKFYSFNWEKEGIDAYFMREVPTGISGHEQSLGFRNLWLKRFTSSQSGIGKGFLTLNFKNEVK